MAKYIELKESLLGDGQLGKMSDEVYSKIEDVQNLLETLRDYCSRIGTPRDSKTFRKDLKEKLMNTTLDLKRVTDLVNKMENIDVPDNMKDNKKKQIRRLREACNKELKDATDLMKNIEKMEKIYVQNAKANLQNEKDAAASFDHENQSQSMSKQWAQIDADQELLREREQDIIELTKLMTEMNAMAKLQAKYIQEQGEELDIVYENVAQSKQNTKDAKKELETAKQYKEASVKSNTKMLIIAAIVCTIAIIFFLLGTSPEDEDTSSPIVSSEEDSAV